MSGIYPVNTSNFDLNLLRVLDALMRERNVSRAAERLRGLTVRTAHPTD
jgi:hypothetical protein